MWPNTVVPEAGAAPGLHGGPTGEGAGSVFRDAWCDRTGLGREPAHTTRAGARPGRALAATGSSSGSSPLRDLKLRYKQAALGAAWSIMQPRRRRRHPHVVFHTVVSLPSDGLPYLPFAMVGYAGWTLLLPEHRPRPPAASSPTSSLITKVYFPRLPRADRGGPARASSTSRSGCSRSRS